MRQSDWTGQRGCYEAAEIVELARSGRLRIGVCPQDSATRLSAAVIAATRGGVWAPG